MEQDSGLENIRNNQRQKIKAALERFCKSDTNLHANGLANALLSAPRPGPFDTLAAHFEKVVWCNNTPDSASQQQPAYMSPVEPYILQIDKMINSTLQTDFSELMQEFDWRLKKSENISQGGREKSGVKFIQLLELWNKSKFEQFDRYLFDHELRTEADSKEDFKQKLRIYSQKHREHQMSEKKQSTLKYIASKFKSGFDDLYRIYGESEARQLKQNRFPPNPYLPSKSNSSVELADVLVTEEQRHILHSKIESFQKENLIQISYWKDDLRIQKPKQAGTSSKDVEEDKKTAIYFGFALKKPDPNQNSRVINTIPRLALYSIDDEMLYGLQIESMESVTGYRNLTFCVFEMIPAFLESYIHNYIDDTKFTNQ
jgi:hypothetical protein